MTEELRNKILNLLSDEPITSEELGKELDYHPGTIRSNCQILFALGLVKGLSGPKGGYIKIKTKIKN